MGTKIVESPYAQKTAFPLSVCNAIRHCLGMRLHLEDQRDDMFKERDEAKRAYEKAKAENALNQSQELERYGRAVLAIDSLKERIRHYQKRIDELVESPDSPEFDFALEPAALDAMPVKPEPKADDQDEDDPDQGELAPVGRPKPGRVKPEAPDPSMGNGVAEHMRASVKELDLRENIRGKLEAAGLTTIDRVYTMLRDADIGVFADLSDRDVKALKKAMDAYIEKHFKADMAVGGVA